jgi:predicted SAM-dependent methyltransferase
MSQSNGVLTNYLAGLGPYMLEIGAGPSQKPGWLATDLRERVNPNGSYCIGLDATKPFPLPDNRFDFIFCEHIIEHIPFEAGQGMLRECHRVLRPGGVIRIATPSLGFLLRIMSSDRSQLEQDYLKWAVKLFVRSAPAPTNAFFFNNFVRAWGHTFIYDRETLSLAMRTADFAGIKECPIGQSEHQALSGLENVNRLPPGYLELESMIFEGTRL